MRYFAKSKYIALLVCMTYDALAIPKGRGTIYSRKYDRGKMMVIHILETHMELADEQIIDELFMQYGNLYRLKKEFIKANDHAILTNICYGIYRSYINKLKSLDLEVENGN